MTDRAKSGVAKKREERTDATEDRKPLPLDAASRMKARVVLAVLLVGLALWTAASFMPALIWATILAVSLWPLYVKFAKRFASGPSTDRLFVAVSSKDSEAAFRTRPQKELIEETNIRTAQQAAKYVYGNDNTRREFVDKHLSTGRQPSYFESSRTRKRASSEAAPG
jgi:hypothetical protein